MVIAVSTNVWYFAGAGLISLVAFVALILFPAMSSYGRWSERFAATFLSLIILGAMVTIGVVAGLAWVLVSHDVTGINPFTDG